MGDGRYYDSTTVSFCGRGRLSHARGPFFLHVLPVQRSFLRDVGDP